jgi:hypothetical protein
MSSAEKRLRRRLLQHKIGQGNSRARENKVTELEQAVRDAEVELAHRDAQLEKAEKAYYRAIMSDLAAERSASGRPAHWRRRPLPPLVLITDERIEDSALAD